MAELSTTRTLTQLVRSAQLRMTMLDWLRRIGQVLAAVLVFAVLWNLLWPVWLAEANRDWRWGVPVAMLALGLLAVTWQARRKTPPVADIALTLDLRCNLRERLTTALTLPPEWQQSPIGQVVQRDAEQHSQTIELHEVFPLQLRWRLVVLPLLGILAATLPLWWDDLATRWLNRPSAEDRDAQTLLAETTAEAKKKAEIQAKERSKTVRPSKAQELNELEEQKQKLAAEFAEDPYRDTPARLRDKLAELTKLEEDTRKFANEKVDMLKQLDAKYAQLDELKKEAMFQDGPAKDLQEALAQGDLEKAQDELDELSKKSKEKKLDAAEQKQLAEQLERLQDELERLSRDKEREQELKDKIEEAKKNKRDPEALERELEELQKQEAAAAEQMQELGEKLGQAQEALKQENSEEAAEKLAEAAKEVQKLDGQVQDAQEARQLQRALQQQKQQTAEAIAKSGQPGQVTPGQPNGPLQKTNIASNQGGIGAGQRPESKNVDTDKVEERIFGQRDKKGKEIFAGTTDGPSFTKKSETEIGEIIQKATRSAASAPDWGRLPRESQETVREYFEKLGEVPAKK